MSGKIETRMMSRREAFRALGIGAAFGIAMPATLLTSEARAQTPGMDRREDRRENRHDRRDDRRDNRQDRRDNRRDNRQDRRDDRRTTGQGNPRPSGSPQ